MDVPFRDKWHDFFCGKWHRSHATSAPDARTVPNGDEDLVPVIGSGKSDEAPLCGDRVSGSARF
jgi:hypothetical protein